MTMLYKIQSANQIDGTLAIDKRIKKNKKTNSYK